MDVAEDNQCPSLLSETCLASETTLQQMQVYLSATSLQLWETGQTRLREKKNCKA